MNGSLHQFPGAPLEPRSCDVCKTHAGSATIMFNAYLQKDEENEEYPLPPINPADSLRCCDPAGGLRQHSAPVEQMAVARAAVVNANGAGANELAPVQLRAATEKMAAAEKAMKEEKYDLARQLAEQAQVDAQLAASVARSVQAQKAAEASQEDSRVLRKELDRNTR